MPLPFQSDGYGSSDRRNRISFHRSYVYRFPLHCTDIHWYARGLPFGSASVVSRKGRQSYNRTSCGRLLLLALKYWKGVPSRNWNRLSASRTDSRWQEHSSACRRLSGNGRHRPFLHPNLLQCASCVPKRTYPVQESFLWCIAMYIQHRFLRQWFSWQCCCRACLRIKSHSRAMVRA